MAVLHQFIRRTQNRGLVALRTTHILHASTKRGVGDVGHVPRQKKIDTVVRRDRDVRRINGRLRRQGHTLDQRRVEGNGSKALLGAVQSSAGKRCEA